MDITPGLRKFVLAAAGVLAAMVVVLAGAFVFIHTPPGQRWLSGKAEETVAGLELDGFRLGWPFRMRADYLRLADSRGVWLEATAPELVWHPLRLMRRVLDIDRLVARRVEVKRLPEGAGGEGGAPAHLPETVRLDEVRLPISLAAPVLGQPVELELAGTARMEGGGGPVEIAVRAQGGEFARVAGVAGTDYLDLRWYLQLPDLARWQGLAGTTLAGAVSGAGLVVGRLPAPEISGRLDSGGGSAGPVAWRQFGLNGRIIPDHGLWRLALNADMAGPRLNGEAVPVDTASLSLAGDVQPDIGRVRLGALSLVTPLGRAQASGVLENWGRSAVLRVSGQGDALGGRLSGRGVVAGDVWAAKATGRLEVVAHGIASGAAALDRALGRRPRARLAVAVEGGRLALGPSRLEGTGASLWAQGNVLPRLDLWARLALPQAGIVAPGLAGAGTVSAHVGGTVQAPATAGVVMLEDLTMAGAPSGSGVVAFDLPEPAHPRGHLSAQMSLAGTPLTAQARLDRGRGIRLDDLLLASGLSHIRGEVEFGDGVRGRLIGSIPQLRQWEGLIGRPLSGWVEAEAVLDPGRGQSVRLTARGSDMAVAGVPVADASLRLDASGLATATRRLEVAEAMATAAHIPVMLTAPATLTWAAEAVSLPDARFTVGGGQVGVSATLRGKAVAAQARIAALPLALTASGAAGTVSGTIQADGALPAPRVRFALTGRDLGMARTAQANLGKLRAQVDGEWEQGLLRARGEMTDGRALKVTAEGSAALPGDGALDARLHASGDAGKLADALPLGGHILTGRLEAAASVGGTIAAPSLSGHAVLRGGRYENLDSGTVVSPLQAEALLSGDRATLTASGGDGGQGRVTVTGSAGLDGAVAADIVLDRFTALRRDDVEASASGALRLADGRLAGRLTVPRAEVNVGRLKKGGPVHLDVVEINRPGPPPDTAPPRESAPSAELVLAVHAKVEHAFVRGRGLDSEWQGEVDAGGTTAHPSLTGRLVAARGQYDILGKSFKLTPDSAVIFQGGDTIDPALDVTAEAGAADITAQVKIGGTAQAPEMTFTSSPPLPQDEVLARLLFGREAGKLSAFQQLQLAQMAAGGLTGDQSGFDPIGDLRGFLGLDVLGFGSETTQAGKESPTLSAGRYIGRDTFVRVDQGTAGLGKVTVEQGLGGGFSLESSVGELSGGGVGMTWRKDY